MPIQILTSNTLEFKVVIEFMRNPSAAHFVVDSPEDGSQLTPEEAFQIFTANHDSSLLHILFTGGFVPRYLYYTGFLYVLDSQNQNSEDKTDTLFVEGIRYKKY